MRQGSGAFCPLASSSVRVSTRSGVAQNPLQFHLPLPIKRVELEELFSLLREWMLAQIASQNKDCGQLICDGMTHRGSAAQLDSADGAA